MTELKNMTLVKDEELNEVTGGYSGHVGKYDGVIGQTYYFVHDHDHSRVVKGVLVESYEEKFLWWSKRRHAVKIIESSYCNEKPGTIIILQGDAYTMYLYA